METALAYDKKHGETNDPNDFRTINAYAVRTSIWASID